MIATVKIVALDALESLKYLAGAVLLASLVTACMAAGVLCSYVFLQQQAQGLYVFDQIMNLRNIGIVEAVRVPLAVLNWAALIMVPIAAAGIAVRNYAASVTLRCRPISILPSNSDDSRPAGEGGVRLVANS